MRLWMTVLILLLASTALTFAEEVRQPHKGLTLNANLMKAQGNWPTGPVVLMTHGTLAHNGMEIISSLQTLFAENGLSSLAINLSLGLDDRHGMYDCATPHSHQHTEALDEIGLWLNWLKRHGVQKVVLLGHSRGGNQTAWFAAERDNPLVTQVILIAPQTWDERSAMEAYWKRFEKDLRPFFAKAKSLTEEDKPTMWLNDIDFLYCKDTTVMARSFVSYYGSDPRQDTPSLALDIKKPVIVFVGTEDDNYSVLRERFTTLSDAGIVELVEIEGAGHMFRDLYGEELVETAIEFINH